MKKLKNKGFLWKGGEEKEFLKKLIAGYKRSARSKALKKEDKIWDKVIGDGIEWVKKFLNRVKHKVFPDRVKFD